MTFSALFGNPELELWKDAAAPKEDPAGDIGAGLDPAGMGGLQLPGG